MRAKTGSACVHGIKDARKLGPIVDRFADREVKREVWYVKHLHEMCIRVRREFSVLAEGRHIFGRRPKPRAAKQVAINT